MNLQDAIDLYTSPPPDRYQGLIRSLLPRESEAIGAESRLLKEHWHAIFAQLDTLYAVNGDENAVRLAFSSALQEVVLRGPLPAPKAKQCERAVSHSSALSYFTRTLSLPNRVVEDHLDSWSDPGNSNALNACRNLLGQFKTGNRPTWAVPFEPGERRPLEGCTAGECHSRLALYPEIDLSVKLIMTYKLPDSAIQAIPTIGDAYRWNGEQPYWRSFFFPAPVADTVGKTAPIDPAVPGFHEIVHEPVELSNLIHPLHKCW